MGVPELVIVPKGYCWQKRAEELGYEGSLFIPPSPGSPNECLIPGKKRAGGSTPQSGMAGVCISVPLYTCARSQGTQKLKGRVCVGGRNM